MLWLLASGALALIVLYWTLNTLYRKPMLHDFATKSVFVTGTDSGFGRLLALKLDRRGVKVYAGCFTQEGADSLKRDASARLRALRLDVSDRDSILKARDDIEKDLGPGQGLWGVVNNAGMMQGCMFYLTDINDYRRVMEVNFFGPVNVCQIFLPLVQRVRGRIVNVTSVLGRINGVVESYTSSKHALEVYTNGLRLWQQPYGVHVATIEPGAFPTNITSEKTINLDLQRSWEKATPAVRQELGGDDYFKAACEDQSNLTKVISRWTSINRVQMVPNAIIHALGAKRPQHRYAVGHDSRLTIILGMLAPDWLLQLMGQLAVKHQFNVVRARIRAQAKSKN